MPTTSLPLKTRKIGNDDVTAIGYGAMGIAAFYGSVRPDEERLKVRIPINEPILCEDIDV